MVQDTIIIILFFSGYSFLHSIFSGLRIKTFFQKYFPKYFSFYRITFNTLQFILFIALWIFIPKPGDVVYKINGYAIWIFRIMQIFSVIGLILSFSKFRKSEFMGLAQIKRFIKNRKPDLSDEQYELNLSGPYAISRHPLYLFTITLFLFEPVMTLFKLLFVLWLIIYFYIGSFYEERRLVREFGQRYTAYQKNVSRIFPAKWLIELFKP